MDKVEKDLAQQVYQTHFRRNSLVGFLGCAVFFIWSLFDFILGEPQVFFFFILRLTVFCISLSFFAIRNSSWFFQNYMRANILYLFLMMGALLYITCHSEYPLAHFGGVAFLFVIYSMVVISEVKYLLSLVVFLGVWLAFDHSWIMGIEYVPRVTMLAYSVTAILFSIFGVYFQFKTALKREEINQRVMEGRIKLTRSNEERKKLLRVLTHDLSNSLVRIQASTTRLSRLMKDQSDNEKVKSSLDRLEKAGKFQQEVIEHVKMNEALKGGKIKVDLKEVAVRNVIERAEILFKDRMNDKGLGLKVELEKEDLKVLCDEVAFSNHVFNNMISNAIKFSFPGKDIVIKGFTEGDHVHVQVRDQGMGMDRTLLGLIFDPDKRTSRVGTQGEQGTGFGMPLMKTYVELFGGEIEVDSIPHDESSTKESGTTITLKLQRPNP